MLDSIKPVARVSTVDMIRCSIIVNCGISMFSTPWTASRDDSFFHLMITSCIGYPSEEWKHSKRKMNSTLEDSETGVAYLGFHKGRGLMLPQRGSNGVLLFVLMALPDFLSPNRWEHDRVGHWKWGFTQLYKPNSTE